MSFNFYLTISLKKRNGFSQLPLIYTVSSPKIFISYSTGDGQDFGEFVCEKYKDSGYKVFWSERDIFPGDYYERKIFEEISASNFFILIGTRRALNSAWVEKEFLEAKRLGKRLIVCIHKNISTQDIGKSVVGRNIVNQIDYEKFESGSSILRIVDPLLEQQTPFIKPPSPVTNKILVTKNNAHEVSTLPHPYCSPNALNVERSLTEIWDEVVSKNDFSLQDYKKALTKSTYYHPQTSSRVMSLDSTRSNSFVGVYDIYLKERPNDAQLWIDKGWVLRNQGKHSEAMRCFRKAKAIGKSVIAFHRDGRPLYER